MFPNTEFWDELAISSYKQILKKRPNSALIHKNLGLAYVRVGRLNKAVRSFERAIKADKSFTEAYYHLGTTLYKMGKKSQAIRSLTKYAKLQQEEPVVEELLDSLN